MIFNRKTNHPGAIRNHILDAFMIFNDPIGYSSDKGSLILLIQKTYTVEIRYIFKPSSINEPNLNAENSRTGGIAPL